MKGDLLYITHILDCIGRIERYAAAGEERFHEDELLQDGILRNLQVLAESSQRVSLELKARYAGVDWRELSGFRNVLVHDYPGVNLARIWQIVSSDIPGLKHQMREICSEIEKP